jgi:hypothetical protein
MGFEMKGKIKKIFEQQDFPSGFYKREFVITTEEQYPQDVKFTTVKERTEQIANLKEGDAVLVKFDVRGNEYNDKFYVLNLVIPLLRLLQIPLLLRHRCRMCHRCPLHLQRTMMTSPFDRRSGDGQVLV